MPSAQEFKEYLVPGKRVWLTVEDPDTAREGSQSKTKMTVRYGVDGDMVYQGYQVLGTTTFLLFDRIEGTGRKTQSHQNPVTINANRVLYLGVIDAD